MNAYTEKKIDQNAFERTFSFSTSDEYLVWHRDREDREITVLSSDGWMFQLENNLPFLMKEGQNIFVKKGDFHRIIKGSGDLKLLVLKKNRSARSFRVEKLIGIIDKARQDDL